MGRWGNNKANSQALSDAILEMNTNPDKAFAKIQKLADEAAKHDRSDAAVMRQIIENHSHLRR